MVLDFSFASRLFRLSPFGPSYFGPDAYFALFTFRLSLSPFRSVLLPYDDLRLLHRYFDTLPDNCKSSFSSTYILLNIYSLFSHILIHFKYLVKFWRRGFSNLRLAHQNVVTYIPKILHHPFSFLPACLWWRSDTKLACLSLCLVLSELFLIFLVRCGWWIQPFRSW